MTSTFDPPPHDSRVGEPFDAPMVPTLPSLPPRSAGGVAAPPAAPPLDSAPAAVAQPPADFNARKLVESQRVKVAQPAYGELPTAEPGTVNPALEAARQRMAANRRRNDRLARGILLSLAGIVVAAGVGAYFLFQTEDSSGVEPELTVPVTVPATAPVTSPSTVAAPTPSVPNGAATPLGEQVQVVEVLDNLNSGAGASAGVLTDAVSDAQQAVDQVNGVPATDAPPAP